MKPFFSIIVPVYNVAPYLRECLDSVLVQTFADWECLCVNDGSTDDSGAILDEYAQKDSRFRVFHQKNQGVAVARQVALNHLIGTWMVAIDPDDWVEGDYLEKLYNEVRDSDVDMVWCNYYDDKHDKVILHLTKGENDSQRHLEVLLKNQQMGSLWNHCMSLEFISKHRISFPPKGCNIAEDLYFISDFLAYGPKVKWVDVASYHYVDRANSALHSLSNEEAYRPFIDVTSMIVNNLHGRVPELWLEYVKKQLKYCLYDNCNISGKTFFEVFPEVRDIVGIDARRWHKVLFWLSTRGARGCVIYLLKCYRRFLNMVKR